MLVSLGETSQFRDGMSVLNVYDAVKSRPDLLYSFYCRDFIDKLTAGMQ